MKSPISAIGAFDKRAVAESILNMEPLFNINQDEGVYLYRWIIILKMLFANYAMLTTIPKPLTIIALALANACVYFVTTEIVLGTVVFLSLIFYILPGSGKRFGLPTILICSLAMHIKAYEWVIDLYVSICLCWYIVEAYSGQYRKMATMIAFSLSVGWCVCDETSDYLEKFTFMDIVKILSFIIFVYFPSISNLQSKYWHRFLYLYAVVFACVLYRIHYHNYMNSEIADIFAAHKPIEHGHETHSPTGNRVVEYTDAGATIETSLTPVLAEAENIISMHSYPKMHTE